MPARPHDSKQRPQRHGASRRSGGLATVHAATTRVAVNPTTAASEFLGLGTRPARALLDANEKLRSYSCKLTPRIVASRTSRRASRAS